MEIEELEVEMERVAVMVRLRVSVWSRKTQKQGTTNELSKKEVYSTRNR